MGLPTVTLWLICWQITLPIVFLRLLADRSLWQFCLWDYFADKITSPIVSLWLLCWQIPLLIVQITLPIVSLRLLCRQITLPICVSVATLQTNHFANCVPVTTLPTNYFANFNSLCHLCLCDFFADKSLCQETDSSAHLDKRSRQHHVIWNSQFDLHTARKRFVTTATSCVYSLFIVTPATVLVESLC